MRRLAAGPSSRVAHERSRTAPDRPIKRRKLSPSADLPVLASEEVYAQPPKRGSSAATSVTSRRSRWRFDGVEIKTVQDHKRRTPNEDSSTPKQSKMSAAQLLSPEVPSPAVAAGQSSDDYDGWEVPLCADDDMDIVPDSQPSCDEGEDDSMLPSFMKEQKGKARPFADETEESNLPTLAEDVLVPSSKALGKRPQHTSRMQTAPPSYLREDAHSAEREHGQIPSAPLQRANTAFAQLEGLQNVYDLLEQDGSQLDPDQMVAASALTHRIGTLLSEKLSKKLGGNSSGRTRR